MCRSVRKFSRDTCGGVMVLFALGVPILGMGVAGAIELAEINNTKSKLRTIVDAAAIAGASALVIDKSPATTERTRVHADSLANVVRGRWTVETTAVADVPAGKITVTQTAVRGSFFGSLVPPGGFRLQVTSTATNVARAPLCVLGLQSGGSQVVSGIGQAKMSADECLVHSNSDLRAGGASRIEAKAAQSVGAATGSIAPAPLTDVPVRADPFAAVNIAAPGSCNETNIVLVAGTTTLNPGTHCGTFRLYGTAQVVLNPGEHYFVGPEFTISGQAGVTGTDVVVVLKDQTTIDVFGEATLTLEGRRTGPLAGFVLVTDRSYTGTVSLRPTNAKKLLGTIYLPAATLAVAGAGNRIADQSPWTVVVAKALTMAGSPTLVINANYASSPVPIPGGVGPGTSRLER